jgi:O-antigen/teichoic acid export membrane protein
VLNYFKKIFSFLQGRLIAEGRFSGHEGAIFRNMTKLFAGDGLARIIGFITAPIITRIYLPEHMGVLSVFTALVAILAPLATFRYSLAVPLPKNDGLAYNITVLSFIILSVTSILIFLLFYFFGSFLLGLFSMQQIEPYWYLLPIAFLGTGLYELLTSWAIREKAFTPLAKTKVSQKLIGAGMKIVLGLAGLKPLGLLIGQIFTQAGGIATLSRSFKHKFKENAGFVSKRNIQLLSKRYIDFPRYRVPAQFLLALTSRAPLLFFAWHFDAETTGQIGLATMMLSFPITLIGYTTGKAYYAEIAAIGKKMSDKILKITKNITFKLFLFSILPFSVIFLFGPWVFRIVFGEVWYDAGVYARILAIYLLAQFVYSPISEGVFNVFEKQSLVLVLETIRLLSTIIVLALSFYFKWGPIYVLSFYSIMLTIHYVVSTIVVFRLIGKQVIY